MRTRRDGGMCNGDNWTCTSSITRMLWSGDQLLWELKAPGNRIEDTDGSAPAFRSVCYFHAGGIDRPLAIWKDGVGSVLPHENWRGQFAMGIWGVGADGSSGSLRGKRSDCPYGGAPDCIPLAWPGFSTNAWGKTSAQGGTTGDPTYWMGSLVDGMRDRTGQQYMRNRYYDPATGQFTQPDPIGLAGGLNAYGFAAGDPVSYSDPYGLCPDCDAFWMRVAADGLSQGGFGGNLKAAAGIAASTALEFFGINALWRARDEASEGHLLQASATAGLAIVENVPGGKAIRGTRAAVRAGLEGLELGSDMTRSVSRLIRDAGRGEHWGVETIRGGGAMVHRFKAGGDGRSSAIYTYIVDTSGRVVGTLQRAFDEAGNLTHFDPKK